jgi:hypothetical protein
MLRWCQTLQHGQDRLVSPIQSEAGVGCDEVLITNGPVVM